ncbi:MAG: bifunctional 5,10-methylene-tetrahydrofolate dehydrogenase/5,10-methylene-tetrahydrofolate cyclohydrolase, partial [Chlamydiae bacterium]|nr:bifunctional 5,10-methylene-tetrahydrofolate dehydrogenase/5,10-methylene-tetrahydrofolate cyclohydrolase [Chlamydiota bacterium]
MIIDGKKVASEILTELKEKIALSGIKPTLAVLLIGQNPASHLYVKMKKKGCEKVGINSIVKELDENIKEETLLWEIEKLNEDFSVDGILVQLPLPLHISAKKVLMAIDPSKDVDCFHPLNVGKVLIGDDDVLFPATPNGIKTLLQKYQIPVQGKHVVIVGRSNIVGKPLAAMLMQKKEGCDASVTICHSSTKNIAKLTRTADILIVAMGKAKFITAGMVKKGTVVIDVGVNKIETKKGPIIVGDVDFEKAAKKASYITPVPGGVGPMTIAMLLQNTYLSASRRK